MNKDYLLLFIYYLLFMNKDYLLLMNKDYLSIKIIYL